MMNTPAALVYADLTARLRRGPMQGGRSDALQQGWCRAAVQARLAPPAQVIYTDAPESQQQAKILRRWPLGVRHAVL